MAASGTLVSNLTQFGLHLHGHIHHNLPVPRLIEAALVRHEATLSSSGALVAATGSRTGRSPQDKFFVQYPGRESARQLAWGGVNQPVTPAVFEHLQQRIIAYLKDRDLFVLDAS